MAESLPLGHPPSAKEYFGFGVCLGSLRSMSLLKHMPNEKVLNRRYFVGCHLFAESSAGPMHNVHQLA